MDEFAAVTTQTQERPETVAPKPAKRARKKKADPVAEYKKAMQLAERLKAQVEERRVQEHRDFIEELREHVGLGEIEDDPADIELVAKLREKVIGAH